ncbi:hypothetical protein AVEN_965-1 [Araneus ventricosus]|uniref:Uncharacterized protein n=1 Tax=Araneus ventricosus TaxID=182803 RepID=A0A4Y2CWI7_ARAVE|nr:hypothetical protein AVEN_965-1 [Araneus ventricosus]
MSPKISSLKEVIFSYFLGRLWLSGYVSVTGPKGFRLETRFHRRTAVYVTLVLVKSDVVDQMQMCGEEVWGWERHLKCRPRRLTSVQSYEVRRPCYSETGH